MTLSKAQHHSRWTGGVLKSERPEFRARDAITVPGPVRENALARIDLSVVRPAWSSFNSYVFSAAQTHSDLHYHVNIASCLVQNHSITDWSWVE